MRKFIPFLLLTIFFSCKFHHQDYDKIIRNGMIYDGNGGEPFKADIGIRADTIAFIGDPFGSICKRKY
jgi:N-acyl-D-amino-acid deacylase